MQNLHRAFCLFNGSVIKASCVGEDTALSPSVKRKDFLRLLPAFVKEGKEKIIKAGNILILIGKENRQAVKKAGKIATAQNGELLARSIGKASLPAAFLAADLRLNGAVARCH